MAMNKENYSLIKERLDRAKVPLDRQALILAQFQKESGNFNKTLEDMNYSAKRIHEVWPSRFPTIESARPYANNPQALAKKVYGKRADLGNTTEEDGWKYRGRGFVQITGKENYRKYSKLLYGDENVLLDNPELLEDPEIAAEISVAYLNDRAKDAKTADEFTAAVNAATSKEDYENRRKASDAFEKQLILNKAGIPVDVDGVSQPKGETETAWQNFKLTPTPKTSDQQIPYPVTPEQTDVVEPQGTNITEPIGLPDLKNKEDIKRVQQAIGVKADGIWGPVSQQAWKETNDLFVTPTYSEEGMQSVDTEESDLANPFFSVKRWFDSI